MRCETIKDALDALHRQPHCTDVPALSGVYTFEASGVTWYVGESVNLKNRLSTHEFDIYLRKAANLKLKVLVCSNHKEVERWLIDALKPPFNRREGERDFVNGGKQHNMHVKDYAIDGLIRIAAKEGLGAGVRHSVMQTIHILRYPMKDILDKIPGQTLKERAEAVGVSRQTMYVWANECFRPQVELATRISNLTGVPVWQIRDLPMRIEDDDARTASPEASGRVAKDGDSVPSGKRRKAAPRLLRAGGKSRLGGRARQMRPGIG